MTVIPTSGNQRNFCVNLSNIYDIPLANDFAAGITIRKLILKQKSLHNEQRLVYYIDMTFKIFIKKGEDGKYIASVPSLIGCHSQGETIDQARENIEESVKGYLKVAKKFGDKINSDDTQLLETTLYVPAV